MYNTGLKDLLVESEITFSMSNEKMSFENNDVSSGSSSRRMLNSVETSVVKSSIKSKESETIVFQAIIEHSISGDSLKHASSLGNFEIDITVYGYTTSVKSVPFESYDTYKATLEKYYWKLSNAYKIFIAF